MVTLSVATPGTALHEAGSMFEQAYFRQQYGLTNSLFNDYLVVLHEGDTIVATASYCSGTTNPLLVTEAGAPQAFLREDGLPLPRTTFMEYGGRVIVMEHIPHLHQLRYADILNSTLFRIAQLANLELVTGIAGPTAPKIFKRVGLTVRPEPADRKNIERCFPDSWDAFFDAEERRIYIIEVQAHPESLTLPLLKKALAQLPNLICDASAKLHLSLQ